MSGAPAASTTPPLFADIESIELDVKRQTKYFLRCLKTYLPQPYTSNDSNRMSLAFFVLAALDLLSGLTTNTTTQERSGYIDWIYRNQHPKGGFRAFPGTDLGDRQTPENECWDPANVPATYFALASLLVLGDDLSRLRRKEALEWLVTLQREDGSFGETIVSGVICGGWDSRFGYCASGIRYILRGTEEGDVDGCKDVDVDKLIHCIRLSETYDGGISDAPYHEAHAGLTFCGIGALSFLDRLPPSLNSGSSSSPQRSTKVTGPSDLQYTIRWLASRQTATINEEDDFDTNGDETDTPSTCHDAHSFVHPSQFKSTAGKISYESRPSSMFDLDWTGFNGRCNKIADTCYAFWVGGSLAILEHLHLPAQQSLKRWLLQKTAHQALGGFGKHAGDLPDVYHSYLGLAALSLLGDKNLKPLDPTMCISSEAKERLHDIWKRWGVVK